MSSSQHAPAVIDSVKTVASNFGTETATIALIVVIMIVIIIIIVYIFKMIKSNKLKNVVLHSEMIILDDQKMLGPISSDKIGNMTGNGQEYSYSFWLFLSNSYQTTSSHKILFYRGETTGSADTTSFNPSTSPIIALDKNSNKMYIIVATNNSMEVSLDEIINPASNTNDKGYLKATIDYVPLQRWIHIGVCVKDINLYVYTDSEVYTVKTIYDIKKPADSTNARPLIKGTSGDIVIGNDALISGFLSYTQFFNYSLSHKEIIKLYKNGPVKSSWLSWIGLGNYGVRSPIYEIS